jgi:hypothetical protein
MKKVNVLVISSNAFSNVLNNGKTLEAVFKAFDKEQLHQLYFRPQDSKLIDFNFCSNFYTISEISLLKDFLFIRTTNDYGVDKHTKKNDNVAKIIDFFINKSLKPNGLLRDLIWKSNLWKNRNLKKWCNNTQADIVFFVASGFGYTHEIANFASKYLEIPLVSYFADDYLIYPKPKGVFDKIQKIRIKSFFKKTVNNSQLLFGIGDLMVEEYSKYFGKQFFPIMNSTEIFPYIVPQYNFPIVISYFGGLHTGRWEMISRLANLIKGKAIINVYTFDFISDQIKTSFYDSGVFIKDGITGTEYRNELYKSNILLHVESDNKQHRLMTRLSVSTKIPEYLMTGRLVLGFGPSEVASMKILSENEIGIVISSEDKDLEICNDLNELFSDTQKQTEIGLKGYQFAISNFDNNLISKNFKDKLYSLV